MVRAHEAMAMLVAFWVFASGPGCVGGGAYPPRGIHVQADFRSVPDAPPPAKAQEPPPKPEDSTVWVPGEWHWTGSGWQWRKGGWFTPPSEAKLVPWTLLRRADGALFHAPTLWAFDNGHRVPVHGSKAANRDTTSSTSCSPTPPEKPVFEEIEPKPPQ